MPLEYFQILLYVVNKVVNKCDKENKDLGPVVNKKVISEMRLSQIAKNQIMLIYTTTKQTTDMEAQSGS